MEFNKIILFEHLSKYSKTDESGHNLFNDIFLQTSNIGIINKIQSYNIRIYQKSKTKGCYTKEYFRWKFINSLEQLEQMINEVKSQNGI